MVISFLGCGWLGTPLAYKLLKQNLIIKASTTSREKLRVWSEVGIDSFLVHFSPGLTPDISQLMAADILLITVPPGRKNPVRYNSYLQMIDQVCSMASASKLKGVIFTSSTSVYAEECDIVTELTAPRPLTPGGTVILEAENRLRQLDIPVSIVRLAGLIGPGRMPGKFFAGKTDIPNGNSPVNLIHLDDAVSFLEKLILTDLKNSTYNLASPDHPTKEKFYSLAAKKEGLVMPRFTPEKSDWKIIASDSQMVNSFDFSVRDLIGWLGDSET